MEEKLYFKPEGYNKGKKTEKKSKKLHGFLKLVAILAVLGLVVAIILWLLRGKTTVTVPNVRSNKNDFLVCEKDNPEYEVISLLNPISSNAKITFSIKDGNVVSSASLTYTSTYEDNTAANDSRNVTVGAFDHALAAAGLPIGSFSNKFTLYDDKLIVTLTASGDEMVAGVAKFFMMEDVESFDFGNFSVSDYKNIYEREGFICETSLEK